MKKMKGMLACVALSAALMLGMAVPAFAAGEPVVNKTLQLNNGTTVNATFQFDVEAIELETNVPDVMTFTDAPLPTISNIALTPGTTTGTSTVTFNNWPHAGTYAWKVTEKTGTYTGVGEMQYDPQVYTIIADVKNAAQGGGYDVSYIIVKGQATSIDNLPGDKVQSLDFTNKYTKTTTDSGTDLTITKTVAGAQGDKTKKFDFTVTFTVPDNAVLPAGKTATDVLNAITADATAGGATDVVFDPAAQGNTRKVTFKAADSKSITFSNIMTGVTYDIQETAVNGYTQGWAAVSNGTNVTTQAGILIGENANSGVMTNTNDVTPPTALVLNNLPFILLGLVAVAGLVGYVVAKRKVRN